MNYESFPQFGVGEKIIIYLLLNHRYLLYMVPIALLGFAWRWADAYVDRIRHFWHFPYYIGPFSRGAWVAYWIRTLTLPLLFAYPPPGPEIGFYMAACFWGTPVLALCIDLWDLKKK